MLQFHDFVWVATFLARDDASSAFAERSVSIRSGGGVFLWVLVLRSSDVMVRSAAKAGRSRSSTRRLAISDRRLSPVPLAVSISAASRGPCRPGARSDLPVEDCAFDGVRQFLRSMASDGANGGAGARQQRPQCRKPELSREVGRPVQPPPLRQPPLQRARPGHGTRASLPEIDQHVRRQPRGIVGRHRLEVGAVVEDEAGDDVLVLGEPQLLAGGCRALDRDRERVTLRRSASVSPSRRLGEHEKPWGADERLSVVGWAHGW